VTAEKLGVEMAGMNRPNLLSTGPSFWSPSGRSGAGLGVEAGLIYVLSARYDVDVFRFAVHQNALLRMKDKSGMLEVWWPTASEWHVLPEMEAWFEGRPVSRDQAMSEYPGVTLDSATVYDYDWTPEPR